MQRLADCVLRVVRFPAQAATGLRLDDMRRCGLRGGRERLVIDLNRGEGAGLAGRSTTSCKAGGNGLLIESHTAAGPARRSC